MKAEMTDILTERLRFRSLTPSEVTERYVYWLSDSEVNRYLESRFSAAGASAKSWNYRPRGVRGFRGPHPGLSDLQIRI
jgi:hypothetical protein